MQKSGIYLISITLFFNHLNYLEHRLVWRVVRRVLFLMVENKRYRDRKSGMNSFDFQLSKLKPLCRAINRNAYAKVKKWFFISEFPGNWLEFGSICNDFWTIWDIQIQVKKSGIQSCYRNSIFKLNSEKYQNFLFRAGIVIFA